MALLQNSGKNSPSAHHRTNLSGYRHIFATKARIDNRTISPTSIHNMVYFGPLAAEINSLVWGTIATFNGFRVLASLLQRRRSMEANQTLRDVWPSPGLVHYIYIFGGSCPLTEFCQVQNSLSPNLALSYIGRVTARHSSSGRQPNFAPFSRGRHLY